MKLRHTLTSNQILWFTKLLLLLTSVYVKLVETQQCLERCKCLWVKGKKTADCNGLGLTKLPQISDKAFANGIQAINLTRNNLVELKRNIFLNSNLVNLQKISLQKVGLERIDENAFYSLNNIVDLDLSSNSLNYIPSQSLAHMKLLRSLDLSSNQISSVPKQSFYNLTNLKILSLSRNRISLIDENAFKGLENLESLKLSANQLINIESRALLPLIKVHSLTLSDNKWECDCKMRPIRKFLLSNPRINIPDEPKCVDSHKIWTHLGLDSFLCPPVILSNYSSSNLDVIEGSTLKLECAIILDTGVDDSQPFAIHWYWQNIPITNNSKGCGEDCQIQNESTQYFLITERIQTNRLYEQKLKISRLELSSVLSINSGSYMCNAQNGAGTAQKSFAVSVKTLQNKGKVTVAAASSESHYINDSEDTKLPEGGTDKVVVGLVLGILFGIFLVLVLFGISVILLCRRRQQKQTNINGTSGMTDDAELEKLTTNSIASTIVNPIQKPPRLGLEKNNKDYATPQVWLIKRNGNSNLSHDEEDGCTQLLFNDNFDRQTLSTITDITNEPDLIHPSAYYRDRLQVTDLDRLSLHSDGTEV